MDPDLTPENIALGSARARPSLRGASQGNGGANKAAPVSRRFRFRMGPSCDSLSFPSGNTVNGYRLVAVDSIRLQKSPRTGDGRSGKWA